jgi:hypothetical protein
MVSRLVLLPVPDLSELTQERSIFTRNRSLSYVLETTLHSC